MNLVPDEQVPVTPVEAALEVGLVHGVAKHLSMVVTGYIACVVPAQVKDGGLCVTNLAKDLLVLRIPTVAPLSLPVVGDVISNLVVPDNLQIQIHNGDIKVCLNRIIQMQLRKANARSEENEE